MACDGTSTRAILSFCYLDLMPFPCPRVDLLPRLQFLRKKSVPPWCSRVAWAPRAPPASDLGAHRADFSHFLPRSSQLCSFSLLKSVTVEASPLLVMGLALPCGAAAVNWVELDGTSHVRHGAALCSSPRFPPTPGHGHLIHGVSSALASFGIAALPSPVDARNIGMVGYPGIQR